ncbi:50S ribosomal protein L23 family protein [Teladorsagia circumcincta]|uniref:50S ribosomal protein L23 family protein n=1 Tax=Teladorsagia circumcincta TaxID=45464 RepID=A0A2G9UAC7_TELCI|nr:50S ribosomal protein L23 family protein [Teladorsagia circumcincta]
MSGLLADCRGEVSQIPLGETVKLNARNEIGVGLMLAPKSKPSAFDEAIERPPEMDYEESRGLTWIIPVARDLCCALSAALSEKTSSLKMKALQ